MKPLVCLSVALLLTQSAWAQQYELVEPSGIVSGTIEVGRGRLLVFSGRGERVYFSRESRYDSPDGLFLGYFNFELNRVLRFPRSGNGLLQTADLDDAAPRFRHTRRIVRPAQAVTGRGAITQPWHGGQDYGGYDPSYAPINPGYRRPYAFGYAPRPQSVLIESATIPNPPLPPARVVLRNDGPREVQVGVVDLKNPSGTRSLRIPPGRATEVELIRDSGAKRVAHYRVVTPYGDSVTKEIITDIPPSPRYEVVVHEWAMQSIAIDRTGKSPNPIEDINFQGKGLGRFPLPPGPQLESGTIEVYRAALSRGNEGTIAPILAEEERPADTASPLERAILEAQRAAQGR